MFRKKYCKTNNLAFQWDSVDDFDRLRRDLNKYEVVYAQFCHEDMRGGLWTRASLTVGKAIALLPSLGTSTLVPSGHHRYVRFLVHSRVDEQPDDPLKGTWGILERIEQGPSVFLFEGEAGSKRVSAKLTKRGPLGDPVEMTVFPPVLLGDLFVDIGRYNGDYHLVANNCINYGLEVWRRLGGTLSWADVCGGHATDKQLANPDPEKDAETAGIQSGSTTDEQSNPDENGDTTGVPQNSSTTDEQTDPDKDANTADVQNSNVEI